MDTDALAALAPSLRSENPWPALEQLQIWCRATPILRIRAVLLTLPEPAKATIAPAVKDILARYPKTIWGVPILLYGQRAPEQGNVLLSSSAAGEVVALRQVMAGPAIRAGNTLLANRTQAALLRIEGDALDPPQLPDDWPQAMFAPGQGTVHVAGGHAFPWPEAVEASMLMYSAAQSPGAPDNGESVWLTERSWWYAKETAQRFRQAVVEAAGD